MRASSSPAVQARDLLAAQNTISEIQTTYSFSATGLQVPPSAYCAID